jgi:hypothetical protein
MGHILIKCPKTDETVATGIAMDKRSFPDKRNVMKGIKFRCPACNEMHAWDKKDAWVQE